MWGTPRRRSLEDMEITQLATALVTLIGVVVVALVAVVPNVMDLEQGAH